MSEQEVIGSFLKANLQLIFLEVKTHLQRQSSLRGRMITYSVVIQTHYASLADLVNAQPQSHREHINKIKTGYCSRSRWEDGWINWEGTWQYRGRRDLISPEATAEVVPAFLQKCLARHHLLPL